MEKPNWATTQDLLDAAKHIKKEKLHAKARVEVFIEGSDKRYGIVSMSHYHVIPNLVLRLEEITDNEAR